MTWHPEELTAIEKRKKSSVIFVGSMYDIFGEWVPSDWIHWILDTANNCPQHTFLFLTKNPKRYLEFENAMPENCWYGATVTMPEAQMIWGSHSFVSIEPLLSDFGDGGFAEDTAAVIIGAMTGPGAVKPEKAWVENLIEKAGKRPLFIKNNLLALFSDLPRRQETAWVL
jgi:protein gp37